MTLSVGSHFHTQLIFSLYCFRIIFRILSQTEEGCLCIILLKYVKNLVGGVRIRAVVHGDGHHRLGRVDGRIDPQLKSCGKPRAICGLRRHLNRVVRTVLCRRQDAVIRYGDQSLFTAAPFQFCIRGVLWCKRYIQLHSLTHTNSGSWRAYGQICDRHAVVRFLVYVLFRLLVGTACA